MELNFPLFFLFHSTHCCGRLRLPLSVVRPLVSDPISEQDVFESAKDFLSQEFGVPVHIVWAEFPIHPKLRQEYFPDIKRTQSLKYAMLRDGKILLRRTLVEGGEGAGNEFDFDESQGLDSHDVSPFIQ